jgi:hypothetical protein
MRSGALHTQLHYWEYPRMPFDLHPFQRLPLNATTTRTTDLSEKLPPNHGEQYNRSEPEFAANLHSNVL